MDNVTRGTHPTELIVVTAYIHRVYPVDKTSNPENNIRIGGLTR